MESPALSYPKERFERALAHLESHADVYAGAAKLVHADFGPKHVLVNGGVRALIDFKVCRGGDPVYDIATWDIYFHNSLRTEWLLDRIESRPKGKLSRRDAIDAVDAERARR